MAEGETSSIGEGAQVNKSIIERNVVIDPKVKVSNSVILSDCRIRTEEADGLIVNKLIFNPTVLDPTAKTYGEQAELSACTVIDISNL